MVIDTFAKPTTDLAFPALTVCRRSKFDAGEYLRAVFDNFEFSCDASVAGECERTALIRRHFPIFSEFWPRSAASVVDSITLRTFA